MTKPVHIIGAGMAGSEAAWQLASAGVPVILHEMRPHVATFAHKTGGFAELVCSNSFRSDDAEQNAVGLLHWEMRQSGSLIMAMADRHQVPAGGALAVDRDAFSAEVTETLKRHPLVTVAEGEIAGLPPEDWERVIIATGDSNRQTRALARNVADKVRESGEQVLSIEGEDSGEWVLVDLGSIVVHVMQPAVRAYYNLEELWAGTPLRAGRPSVARSA